MSVFKELNREIANTPTVLRIMAQCKAILKTRIVQPAHRDVTLSN